MLILHPLSRCDVCLDEYSFASPQQTPHAISCGHVFCHPCLSRLNPSICPLCRKAFLRDRIKRLHVDRVPPDEAGVTPATPRIGYSQTQLEEIELLQRLALASGEDTPESELAQIIVEVEEWLTGRNADASRALRKALTAIQRHKRKESEWQNQSEMYRLLKHEYKRKRKIYDHDMTRAKIVEDNLMEHLQNLESQHRSQLESAQREAESLRQQLARLTMRSRPSSPFGSNPLPPPPKPFADDVIPDLIDKGKALEAPRLSSKDPSNGEGPGYISRAGSEDWRGWYSIWQNTQESADGPRHDPPPSAIAGSNNVAANRALSVVPGAHPAQRVVPPLNVRDKSRVQDDAPALVADSSVRVVEWSAETLAAAERLAGITRTQNGTARRSGEQLPQSSRQADGRSGSSAASPDDATPTMGPTTVSRISVSDFPLTHPPAGGSHPAVDGGNRNLRSLLGFSSGAEVTATHAAQTVQNQDHPSSLRPGPANGSALSASSWGTTAVNASRVSRSSLGLGLGRFADALGEGSRANADESGLGLRIGRNVAPLGQNDAHMGRASINQRNNDVASSDDDDDEDDEADYFTPRASTSTTVLFNMDAARRSEQTASHAHESRSTHDSGAVTDEESARGSGPSRSLRPAHGRSVSHQIPPQASGSGPLPNANQRTAQPAPSGRRSRRTSAPDPPPPTVSFIPPVYHSQGGIAPAPVTSTLTLTMPSTTSASSSRRHIATFNVSGALSYMQQNASRAQAAGPTVTREVAEPMPRREQDFSQFWSTATSLFSSGNPQSSSRRR